MREFDLLAYVFMPDHVHALVAGRSPTSDFLAFMRVLRQRMSTTYHDLGADDRLWQDGYYEHVLRSDEASERLITYMLANPVRAGLVENAADYKYGWSVTLST
jgi:REP element-mobilizing transposase RayT